MVEEISNRDRLNWRLPLYSGVGSTVVLLLLFLRGSDASWLHILVIGPIFCFSCLILLLIAAFRKRPLRCLSILLTIIAFLVVSWALLVNENALRPALRWMLFSQRYKSELLAQPASANGELKHLQRDVWGWGPIGPTIVYLVFDPNDSLSTAAKSRRAGQFGGMPCEVSRVQRLESHWYAVTFYTEESWGEHNRLNCSGSGG
jgi:hypothetical protein